MLQAHRFTSGPDREIETFGSRHGTALGVKTESSPRKKSFF
jgi:hypothetical protein